MAEAHATANMNAPRATAQDPSGTAAVWPSGPSVLYETRQAQ